MVHMSHRTEDDTYRLSGSRVKASSLAKVPIRFGKRIITLASEDGWGQGHRRYTVQYMYAIELMNTVKTNLVVAFL